MVTLCLYQIRLNNQTGGDQDSIFVAAYPNALQFYTGVGYYGLPKFFGTTLYAFDINGVITEIRVEMQKQFQFTTVLLISMIIEASIYIFVGTIGSHTYTNIIRLCGLWTVHRSDHHYQRHHDHTEYRPWISFHIFVFPGTLLNLAHDYGDTEQCCCLPHHNRNNQETIHHAGRPP